MKKTAALISVLIGAGILPAADLVIDGQSNRTYENQTYGRLSVSGSSNITIRNCIFAAASGAVVDIQSGSNNVTVDSCDIDGRVDACTGVRIGGASHHITVKNCDIHDIADDGFEIYGAQYIYLRYNTVRALYGCGTDNGCGPCYNGHSDGIEPYDVHHFDMIGNLIYDVRSTSALIMGSLPWDEVYCSDVNIINNIFYTPECGIVVYIDHTHGLNIYNNIFWKGSWQGLALGKDVLDMRIKNNILQNINYTYMEGTYDSTIHDIDYNLFALANAGCPTTGFKHNRLVPNHNFAKIPHAYSSTTYRSVTAADFAPLATNQTIDAGFAGTGIPETDYFGRARVDAAGTPNTGSGTVSYCDIGPFEYIPPTALTDGPVPVLLSSALITVHPHPFTAGTVLDLRNFLAGRPGARVQIFCPAQKVVRTWQLKAGEGRVTWDGRDDRGRRLKSGLYLIEAENSGHTVVKSVLLLE